MTLVWSDIDGSLWALLVSVLPWVCVLMDPSEAGTGAVTKINILAPLPLQGQTPPVSPGQGYPAASLPVDEVAPVGARVVK